MKICLLTHQDLDAHPFPADDFRCDPRPFLPKDDWHVETLLCNQTSVARVEALIDEGFDLFFNLCDGTPRDGYPGIEIVRVLEKHGAAFTGPTSRFFDPSRRQMKNACRAAGIHAPRDVVVRDELDVEKALAKLRFPMIVKRYYSYASLDLSRQSRVVSEAGLRRQVRKILARDGAAIVEEFIDGVECTVLVAETPGRPKRPTVYPPVQYRFPEGESFKHERLKWIDFGGLDAFPVEDPQLAERLREESARFFLALGGDGFGRADVRIDESGTPYMLEMNPLCGIYFEKEEYGGADLCLSLEADGHVAFTRQLADAGLARGRRRRRRSAGR